MKKIVLTLVGSSLLLTGCATASSGVVTAYSSPMMYSGYSCAQLAMEDRMLRSRVAELKGVVDQSATNDKVMVGVGVVFFWPALFFVKGNGEAQASYAEMKGQHEAIEQAFVLRNCAAGGPQPAAYGQPAFGPGYAPAAVPVVQAAGFADGTALAGETHRF